MFSKFRLIEIALKPQFLRRNLNLHPHTEKSLNYTPRIMKKIDLHRGGEINHLKFERGECT